MAKIKVRKDVAEQVISKLKPAENGLKTPKNSIFNVDFAENTQNQQVTSKLEANKNIFARGDFDEYKISDEELKAHYGQTADGKIYDLTDPTEKFYYDLKTKFAENDKTDDIEKSHLYRDKKWMNGHWVYNYDEKKLGVKFIRHKNGLKDYKGKDLFFKLNPDNYNLLEYFVDGSHDYVFINKENENERIPAWKVLKIDHNEYLLRTELRNTFKKEMAKYKQTNFHNKDLTFRFSQKSIDKLSCDKAINKSVLNGFSTKEHFEAASKIKELVENVENFKKYPDRKGVDNVEAIYRGNIPIQLSTRKGMAYITIKEYKITGKLVYSVELMLKKYPLQNSKGFKGRQLNKALQLQPDCSLSPSVNIAHCNNLSSKNVTKSLTYSGHKLQGRTRLYGMDISIENKKGSYRSGVDKDGHKWKTLMHYDYGYIRGTVGTDKDHLDCYVGPDKEAQKVYVIHQNDPVTHKYDEDKCMLCFSSAADAKAAYMKQYDRPGFYGSMTTMTIEQFKSFISSHKGKMVHKSFDINITDITENNKQQKLEQVNKALNAIADNRPFMIKHIPADSSTNYGNLLVRITDFDRSKIEKAVHKIALSLDADISGASKGETFVYKAQEELVDKYFKEFTNRTRAIYDFVIGYFDLPDIRIVSKAGELRYKGKILYNPETGLPIKESEWKKFIVELEKFLNRNYTGIGEKIVLSAESLGIILDRLSKTNSLDGIRKMSVADLKAKRYDVDWIGDSIKNMKDKFGDVISRERQARIQIAMDSAAQRVTRVKDDMRNNIQQIIIDGIRDKQSKSVVAQNLFDKCASLNRDMQRIADSEVQMAANSAYIQEEVYNTEPGSKVYFKRFEMMDDNTCKKCKKLNGTIVLWSDVPLPDERIKDPFAKYAIWDGKNDGDCPVGIVHPWCRGSWIRYYPEV